ncbi:MAG: hypothetical protein PHQ42_02920 [Patescibacteria group bacterium]|nr:hypothetical protein [Patescibacteria group bacterium]
MFTIEEAKNIGESLEIKWDKFDVEQFRAGMDVEMEPGLAGFHTNITDDDSMITGKITLARPNELPDYYARMEKMEKEGEKFQEGKK